MSPHRNALVPPSLAASTMLALLVASTACLAQDRPPAAKPPPVPSFTTLPHTPLPHGEFIAWCGRKDRYLLASDNYYVDAYDDATKISAPSATASRSVQCGPDGRHLLFAEDDAGRVRKIELETGNSQILATFQKRENVGPTISFAPDLKSAATNVRLQLTAEGEGLRLIDLPMRPANIRWSEDSLKVFVVHSEAVDVLDKEGRRIGGGRLPKGTFFREGWFDLERQALLLLLGRTIDESGPGPFLKCPIVDWKCVRLKERVEQASVGGHGLIATVGPLDRPKMPDDDATVLYSRYAAELHDSAFRLLFRQEFRRDTGQTNPRLYVAPSAAKAVLSWLRSDEANCPAGTTDEKCQPGWILDLTKVVK